MDEGWRTSSWGLPPERYFGTWSTVRGGAIGRVYGVESWPPKDRTPVEREERPADYGRCEHRCYPVEAILVDGGRRARCLGCGLCEPVRASAIVALAALRDPGAPEAETRRHHLRLVGA
jgi:NAD-dependent dihydropyrimidine dehydrogenase PreA subunit